jgi:hypothetical protein
MASRGRGGAGTGGGIGDPLAPWQPLAPYEPYNPLQGDYWKMMGENWQVNPDDYLGEFEGYYGDMFDTMQGGIKDWDTAWKSLLGDTSQRMGNMGLGLYDSDLLRQLTGEISGNLANPDSAIAMGLMKDRRAGTERAARESLTDQLAGWGRDSGVGLDMQRQLERDLAKTASEQDRQQGLDIQKQAIADAMGLEDMKGGFYEGSKGRELKSRQTELDYLAKLYSMMPAFLSGKEQLYSSMPGMLNSLTDMMKYQGSLENQADTQEYQNLIGLSQQEENAERERYAGAKQYRNEMDTYGQEMNAWNYQMKPYNAMQNNPASGYQGWQNQNPRGGNWSWW